MCIITLTEPDTPLNDAYHVGSFNFMGRRLSMGLKQYQPPMTVEEQINNLKLLGLVIDDEDKAEDFLNDVSYFRLIKAYSPRLNQKIQIIITE